MSAGLIVEYAAAEPNDMAHIQVFAQRTLDLAPLQLRIAVGIEQALLGNERRALSVDVHGTALSVVTIDRLPFPRPDDPLLQARRERLGREAFALIDVPRAATLLAQGAGRLIRSANDRGVVAVLDSRYADILAFGTKTPGGDAHATDNNHELTAGVNYYVFDDRAKITGDISFLPNGSTVDAPGLDILANQQHSEWIGRVQFQLGI